jgi:prefoldin alpha subunit
MSAQQSEEEKMNALAVEVRVLESTYNELSSRQNILERALLENRAALETLKGLDGTTPTEVLVQIGGGVLVRSSPPSVDKVLVNVGASVVIEKPKDEAMAIMETRARDAENSIISLLNERNQIAERLEADRQVLQALLARQSQKD